MQAGRALHDIPLHQKLCDQEDRAARLAERKQQLGQKLNTILGLIGSSTNRQAPKPTGQQHSSQATDQEQATYITNFDINVHLCVKTSILV